MDDSCARIGFQLFDRPRLIAVLHLPPIASPADAGKGTEIRLDPKEKGARREQRGVTGRDKTHAKTSGRNRLVSFGGRVRDARAGGRHNRRRGWRCYCGRTRRGRGRGSCGRNRGRARRAAITPARPLLRQGSLWPYCLLPPWAASLCLLLTRRNPGRTLIDLPSHIGVLWHWGDASAGVFSCSEPFRSRSRQPSPRFGVTLHALKGSKRLTL